MTCGKCSGSGIHSFFDRYAECTREQPCPVCGGTGIIDVTDGNINLSGNEILAISYTHRCCHPTPDTSTLSDNAKYFSVEDISAFLHKCQLLGLG